MNFARTYSGYLLRYSSAYAVVVGICLVFFDLLQEMGSSMDRWEPVRSALTDALGGTLKEPFDFDGESWTAVFRVLDKFADMTGVLSKVAGWIGIDRSTLGKRYTQRASSSYGQGRKPQVPKFFAEAIAERLKLSAQLWRCEPRTQGLQKISTATTKAGFGPVSMRVARRIAARGGVSVKKGEATGSQKVLSVSKLKMQTWYSNLERAGANILPATSIFNMDEHDLNGRAKKSHPVRLP